MQGKLTNVTYIISNFLLQCEASASLKGFLDQITNESAPRIMLIGSDCSVSSEAIAEISHHWNLVQARYTNISYHLSMHDAIDFSFKLVTTSFKH